VQGNLIATGCLFRSDKRPGTKLIHDDGRTSILKLGTRPAADAVKVKIIADLD
jgi:hypothetical protein